MKKMKFLLFVVSVVFSFYHPLFSQANNGNEAKITQSIDALDYYSSRMISGIGLKFYQYSEEKIDGRQETEIRPQLYLNLHPGFSLIVTSRTASKNIVESEGLNFSTPPISSSIHFESQIRPFSNVQVFPYIKINKSKHAYNSELESTILFQDENKEYDIGIDGIYLSSNGKITPTPRQLNQSFYASQRLPMVQQKQWMIRFAGAIKSTDFNALSEKKSKYEPDQNYEKFFNTKWKEYSLNIDADYGITRNAVLGLKSQIELFTNNLSLYEERTTEQNEQHILTMSTGPHLHLQFNDNFYHQLSARFSSIDVQEKFETASRQKTPQWQGQYNFYWLLNSAAISTQKLLANHNGFLGNRLSKRGGLFYFGVTRVADFSINKIDRFIQDHELYNAYNQALESSSFHSEMAIKYGISDYFELGAIVRWQQDRSFIPHPLSGQSTWFEKTCWTNSLVFKFANFCYSDELEQTYGWSSLTPFDQFTNRPIFKPLMFMGQVSIEFIGDQKADGYFKMIDHYNPLLWGSITPYATNKEWQLSEEFVFGLWKNLEIRQAGQFLAYSSELRNYLDKDWHIDITLSWQFFKSLRLQVCQSSMKYVNNWDTRFNYYLDPYYSASSFEAKLYNKTINTWVVQLSSLF
jgi:hypothetical protein